MMAKPQILSFTQPTTLPLGPSQIILSLYPLICVEKKWFSPAVLKVGSPDQEHQHPGESSENCYKGGWGSIYGSKKYLSGDGNFAKGTLSSKAQNSHPSREEASGYFDDSDHKDPGYSVKQDMTENRIAAQDIAQNGSDGKTQRFLKQMKWEENEDRLGNIQEDKRVTPTTGTRGHQTTQWIRSLIFNGIAAVRPPPV